MKFVPDVAFFEPEALDHPRGREIERKLTREGGTDIETLPPNNRVTGLPGCTPQVAYRHSKRALVVRVQRTFEYPSCRPSADYQLPLSGSCPGMCQYCYLMTRFGKKPYVRVYVNVSEILDRAEQYAGERLPESTSFEGAAVSDPLPVERYTGALGETVRHIGARPNILFRFATKFTEVEFLQNLPHQGRTTVRFSINTPQIIRQFEYRTPSLDSRLEAARKVREYGYPIGFLIAPIICSGNWRNEYRKLLMQIASIEPPFTLELISHRFTESARKRIIELFPNTSLPLDREARRFKRGKFGLGKYVYPESKMESIREWFASEVQDLLPGVEILYTV